MLNGCSRYMKWRAFFLTHLSWAWISKKSGDFHSKYTVHSETTQSSFLKIPSKNVVGDFYSIYIQNWCSRPLLGYTQRNHMMAQTLKVRKATCTMFNWEFLSMYFKNTSVIHCTSTIFILYPERRKTESWREKNPDVWNTGQNFMTCILKALFMKS